MSKNTKSIAAYTLDELYKMPDEEIKKILKECIKTYRSEHEVGETEFCCEICYCDKPLIEGFRNTCGHIFCKECWQSCIMETQVKGNEHIHCPEQGCFEKVEIQRVYNEILTDEDDINKFGVYVERYSKKQFDDHIGTCPNCQIDVYTEKKEQFLTCPNESCNHKFCRLCPRGWHKGKTCDEYAEELERRKIQNEKDEKANEEFFRTNTRICANCKFRIYKDGGCNHMTCRKCGYEFCWLCLAKWTSYAHFRNNTTTGCIQNGYPPGYVHPPYQKS